MRNIIGITLTQMAEKMTLSDMVKAVISGDLAKDLAKACRVVIPIKRLEIRKTEVRKEGDGEPESIIEVAQAPTPAEAEPEQEVAEEAVSEETAPEEEAAEEAASEESSDQDQE
jgi:small subunit ribosomal protein S3Ae